MAHLTLIQTALFTSRERITQFLLLTFPFRSLLTEDRSKDAIIATKLASIWTLKPAHTFIQLPIATALEANPFIVTLLTIS
mmetsp:Transcript_24191/g.36004  ORF Transcript_24191/g.36004 Transcript_24191/m.36004 type:complete len:81 (-) Transcript_24191:189-431(-)